MCQDLSFSSAMYRTENTKIPSEYFTFILGKALTKQPIAVQTLLQDKQFLVFTNQTMHDCTVSSEPSYQSLIFKSGLACSVIPLKAQVCPWMYSNYLQCRTLHNRPEAELQEAVI